MGIFQKFQGQVPSGNAGYRPPKSRQKSAVNRPKRGLRKGPSGRGPVGIRCVEAVFGVVGSNGRRPAKGRIGAVHPYWGKSESEPKNDNKVRKQNRGEKGSEPKEKIRNQKLKK